ncbi:Uncharacterised protein [Vibrio cholerae]|nr:Uncharacterised protein [Vibrio cholerae]
MAHVWLDVVKQVYQQFNTFTVITHFFLVIIEFALKFIFATSQAHNFKYAVHRFLFLLLMQLRRLKHNNSFHNRLKINMRLILTNKSPFKARANCTSEIMRYIMCAIHEDMMSNHA